MTVRELEVRYGRPVGPTLDGRRPITCARDVRAWLVEALGDLSEERVYVLHLDARGRPLGVHEAARGGLVSADVDLRLLLRAALLSGAASVIVAHSHPSGDPTPSPEDLALASTIGAGCRAVGLAMLDFVVVAGPRVWSRLDGREV